MKCKRCTGRVLVDRVLTADTHLELYCMACGKRWSFHYPQHQPFFVLWLHQKEKQLSRKTSNG